jgi:hypothetical protein
MGEEERGRGAAPGGATGVNRPRRVAVAGALAAAALVAAGVQALRNGEPAPENVSREGRIYRALIAGDYTSLARAAGMEVAGVHGMMPPAQADREEHWLVYVGLEGRDGRHRVAFQVWPAEEHAERAAELVRMGYAPCREDYDGWECFAVEDGIAIQGEAVCLRRGCDVSRREAKLLLDLGRQHVRSLLAAR